MTGVHKLLGLLAIACTLFPINAVSQSKPFVFPGACLDCHGSEAKYSVLGARAQHNTAAHNTFPNANYANADGCQNCHTNEGFIEYAKTGKVDPKKVVANPSGIGCFTCHAPHERGDFSLRKITAVTLSNGAVFNKGASNLCANCHQARVTPKAEVRPRPILAEPWGPHHGPQSDMLLGTNAYEFPGKKYSKSAHASLPGVGCVSCHMAQPAGRYGLAPSVGGHSMRLSGEVHHAPKVNVAGCIGCHKDLKQAPGKHLFDYKAAADFDGNKRLETVQEEVMGLLEMIINKKGTGLLQIAKNPLYDATGKFIANNKTEQPVEIVATLYNYKYVLEDRSKGMHNTVYAVQLLMDSIKSLNKGFDDSKRPE